LLSAYSYLRGPDIFIEEATLENQHEIIDQIGLAIVTFDSNNLIRSANQHFEAMSGYSRKDLVGIRRWQDIISNDFPYTPLDRSGAGNNDNNQVPSGKFWCLLKTAHTGEKIISATLSFSVKQELFIATLYDITDQLSPHRLINDGGVIFGAIADKVSGGLGFHDYQGIIQYVNQHLCDIIGLSRRDILGRHISEFFEKDTCELWLNAMRSHPHRIPPSLEFSSSHTTGKVYHIMASPRLLYNSENMVIGSMFVFTDITELKQTENRLRISDEKYTRAFHSSPAPSSITTLRDGIYLDVNTAYTELVGYTKQELIGNSSAEINLFLKPEDRIDLVDHLLREKKLRNYEVQVFSRVKGIRSFSFSADIIELQGEKCMIWVGYDITESIRLEKEILSIVERERYRIGQYLHDDLGQHIVGVEAMTSLLCQRLENGKNRETGFAIEIRDYLREAIDMTRSSARGLCPVRLEENGFSSAMTDLAEQTEKMFKCTCIFQNHNRANVKIYNSNVAINLYYIVRESVNNALKHGHADKIIIRYSTDIENIHVTIRDNGSGFNPENADQSSTGMGLNLIRYRSRAIGAVLHIISEPGRGTVVSCILPMRNNIIREWDWNRNRDPLKSDADT